MTQLVGEQAISPSLPDRCKRVFLGRPMINDQLQHERLSNPARLQRQWQHFGHVVELRMIDCLDRNLSRAAKDLVLHAMDEHPDTKVTVLLPRREYSQLLGRLLHDRTADKIARVISRIPDASAQIVAYDILTRIAEATAAEDESPSLSSTADKWNDVPEPQRAYLEDLSPQVVDSRGK